MTGSPLADRILAFLGLFYVVASFVANLLPKRWKFTRRLRGAVMHLGEALHPHPAKATRRESDNLKTPVEGHPVHKPRIVPPLPALAVLALLAATCSIGCSGTSTGPLVPIAIDVADFVCDELDQHWQDEPGFVKFACTLIGAAGHMKATPGAAPPAPVIVKVPAADAATFRRRHLAAPPASTSSAAPSAAPSSSASTVKP